MLATISAIAPEAAGCPSDDEFPVGLGLAVTSS